MAKGSTLQFNSLHDQRVIDKAIASDPALYRSEYFSEWRDDLSNFITRELIESAVDVGVLVRSPVRGVRYLAFADPAHGRGDQYPLCISHVEGDKRVVDLVYERQGPGFNPYEVVQEICKILRTYHVTVVHGDNAAADGSPSCSKEWHSL